MASGRFGVTINYLTNSDEIQIKIIQGGDATIAYYFLTEADVCRSQKYELFIGPDGDNLVSVASGEILDFSSGKYVVFDITGIPDDSLVRLNTEKIDTDPTCAAAQDLAFNSHLSGIFVDGTQACAPKAPSRTLGYWKNHPDAWPVDEITCGGTTFTKEEAIELMEQAIPALIETGQPILIDFWRMGCQPCRLNR